MELLLFDVVISLTLYNFFNYIFCIFIPYSVTLQLFYIFSL